MAVPRPHYYLIFVWQQLTAEWRTCVYCKSSSPFFLSTDGPQLEKSWPSCILLPHTIKKSKITPADWMGLVSRNLFSDIFPRRLSFKKTVVLVRGGGGLFRCAFSHDFMHNKTDQWGNTASSLIDRRNSKVLECVCVILIRSKWRTLVPEIHHSSCVSVSL